MCKSLSRKVLLVLLGGLFLASGAAIGAEFTADMTDSQGDYEKSGKLYVKGSQYCMELEQEGEKLMVLVDQEARKTVVLLMSAKEFRELAIDDMNSVMNDPFQGYQYSVDKEFGVEKPGEMATVEGLECKTFDLFSGELKMMSKYVSTKLDFPIKIVAHGNPSRVMALSNIVEGPVDAAKFAIPEGFTAWVDPETLPIEPPEWASGIESAPVLVPPFEKKLMAGDIVRVVPVAGKSLVVKCMSVDETEAEAYIRPFKEGRPIYRSDRYGNAAMEGVICARRHETPVEADEFVIYVKSGGITAVSKWQEMAEKTVGEGETISLPLEGWDEIEMWLVNQNEGESVAVFSYNREGVALGVDEIDEDKWRTIRINEPNGCQKRSVNAKGDELVVTVTTGSMRIKMGQYDVFEF